MIMQQIILFELRWRAYYSRHNVLSCAAPRSEHLLDSADVFSSQETIKHLFAQAFLDAMLKEANQELTLNQIEATEADSSQTRQSNSSNAQRAGRSARGGRRGRGRGRGTRHATPFQSLKSVISAYSMSILSPTVGGRIKLFAENWFLISKDDWIRRSVSSGIAIYFVSLPV